MFSRTRTPSINDTNKELKPLSLEYEKNKKLLAEGKQFLNSADPQLGVQIAQVKSQSAQVELVQANLEAAISILNARKQYIEVLKNNYQLIVQTGFKVGGQDYLIYTFGDDRGRDK